MFVDVHGHLAPLGERAGGPPALFDPAGSIEAKREYGIVLTVIGSPVGAGSMLPGLAGGNYAQPASRVRAHNEKMGELVERFPDALRAYAYLDPFGDDEMLRQAVELIEDWRFVGFVVNSSIGGELLGSPRAEGFFDEASRRRVPILVHPPAEPIGTGAVHRLGLGAVEHLARPLDVTLGIASVLCGGYLERFPGLRLIAAAGGGALCLLAEKMDLAMTRRGEPVPATAPSALLRHVYVETSVASSVHVRANVERFGADRVLFGTDAPPLMDQVAPVTAAVRGAGLAGADAEAVAWRNAAALFGPAVASALPATGGAAAERTETAGVGR